MEGNLGKFLCRKSAGELIRCSDTVVSTSSEAILKKNWQLPATADFQTNPSNGPRNVNAPHETHKAPRHIIKILINSYSGVDFQLSRHIYSTVTIIVVNDCCVLKGLSHENKHLFCCTWFEISLIEDYPLL
jgi:hypothetical protein